MEACLEYAGFPQADLEERHFDSRKGGKTSLKQQEETVMPTEKLALEKGEKATFIVQVQFRQNASWQGEITWTEGKKKQRFRSALEMLKLMDEAMAAQETDEKPLHWEE